MGDLEIRQLTDDDRRRAFDVLAVALLRRQETDESWAEREPGFLAERRFGAFDGYELVGTAGSFGTRLTVPGGRTVPAAAVDGVAVRADHTRRGALTAMMAEQLRDCADRGEAAAILHASEATIYGRFGYGVAARGKTLRLKRNRARFRPDAPRGGQVRMLGRAEAHEALPVLYEKIAGYRPGMIGRPDVWWAKPRLIDPYTVVVHIGPDGADGYVLYQPVDRRTHADPEAGKLLEVRDLQASTVDALAGLWRYLLKVDLADEIVANGRPVDEPLGLMLIDPRACRVVGVEDQLWLRLVDVPSALDARGYGQGEPVVLEIADPILPANSGCYRITPDGAERADAAPDLSMPIDALGMLCLGDRSPGELASAGRIQMQRPEAVAAADALFASATAPWCGTGF